MFETLMQDLRYAFRLLGKNPGFSAVLVLALAVGIGANTAIFSLVNAILLRDLPFKDAEQLVWIWSTRTDRDKAFFSIPDFSDYRDQNHSLEQMVAFANWGANLTGAGDAERLSGIRITANAFEMLGVTAAGGRCLLPDDGKPGSQRTVMITYGLWQRRFGGDRQLIGSNITLNNDSYTVVGVLPPDFIFPGTDAEMAIPLVLESDGRRSDRDANFLRVFARLKPGFTREQAQGDMDTISRTLQQMYPTTNAKKTPPKVFGLRDEIVGGYQAALIMLFGAVGLVLLIACTNLANLMLSRASARRRETAIRIALGASRGRVIKQLLTETSLLALLGGSLGFVLAWQGKAFLMSLSPSNLPRAGEVSLDARVLAFTLIVSLISGAIFGLIPALQASKVDLNEELKGTGKGTGDGAQRTRMRSFLVVSEIALSLVLLISAGLLIKSFSRLQEVSPGFNPDNVLSVRLSLPPTRYPNRAAVTVFFDKVLPRIASLTGVRAVGVTNVLPLSGMNVRADFTIVGRPPLKATEIPAAQNRWVSPGYFEAMGVPLIKGRDFAEQDNAQAPGAVIVDEALARRYWGDDDPIGSRIKLEDGSAKPPEFDVVGIVANVKHVGLDEEPAATFYVPIAQMPDGVVAFFASNCSVAIRTGANPLALERYVRREVQDVDNDVPTSYTRTMEEYLSAATAPRRFTLLLLTIFAATALLLAASGIYAVMAYSVARRTQEIGIRMALGAGPTQVFRLILGGGFKLILLGVVIGLAGAFISTRFIESLLFQITAVDPITFALTPLALITVAMLACYFPARKAAKVDPIVALHGE